MRLTSEFFRKEKDIFTEEAEKCYSKGDIYQGDKFMDIAWLNFCTMLEFEYKEGKYV